jgi:hypothetical protein
MEKSMKRALLLNKKYLHYFAKRGKTPPQQDVASSINKTNSAKAENDPLRF